MEKINKILLEFRSLKFEFVVDLDKKQEKIIADIRNEVAIFVKQFIHLYSERCSKLLLNFNGDNFQEIYENIEKILNI